jgi:hypothetical protein
MYMRSSLRRFALAASIGGWVLWAAVPLSPKPAFGKANPCAQNEICSLRNPEDMVRIEDSQWALVSRLGRDPSAPGGFSLVDLDARTSMVLMPDVSKPAIAVYSDCPRAPIASELLTHGLDIRPSAQGVEVFAVNHGGRESIEVFDLRIDARGASLTWTGCVMVPADISANAVAALPDGLAVSSFGKTGHEGTAELMAGNPSGFVARWRPKQGWSHVAGSEFGGDNGVTAAPNARALYVNDWSDGTLRIVPLAEGVEPITLKLGAFHPDNVHSLPDGNLLVAGQIGSAREIMACATEPTCAVGSMIVVVDPLGQKVLSSSSVAPSSSFGAASTALLYKNHYWLSSFRGDRIMRVRATIPH